MAKERSFLQFLLHEWDNRYKDQIMEEHALNKLRAEISFYYDILLIAWYASLKAKTKKTELLPPSYWTIPKLVEGHTLLRKFDNWDYIDYL